MMKTRSTRNTICKSEWWRIYYLYLLYFLFSSFIASREVVKFFAKMGKKGRRPWQGWRPWLELTGCTGRRPRAAWGGRGWGGRASTRATHYRLMFCHCYWPPSGPDRGIASFPRPHWPSASAPWGLYKSRLLALCRPSTCFDFPQTTMITYHLKPIA